MNNSFEKLEAEIEQQKLARAKAMPDEQTAISQIFEGYLRLKELGFNDAMYCPKDGSTFEAVEAGSTGIHECSYFGDWPTGSWMIASDGDWWPSRPILYRNKKT